MRRIVALVLVGLGAFLLALAPMAHWYIGPKLAVAPLSCDPGPLCEAGVSVSPSGLATVLFDPSTLSARNNIRAQPDPAGGTGPGGQ